MRKLIFAFCIFFLSGNDSFSQGTTKIVGTWTIFEMVSDRIYKNFENDSIHVFENEDKVKYESEEVKKNMSDAFKIFSKVMITFNSDGTFNFDFMGDVEKGRYHFDKARSELVITNASTSHSDTLKFKPAGLIEYDLSDKEEKRIITFKRKGK